MILQPMGMDYLTQQLHADVKQEWTGYRAPWDAKREQLGLDPSLPINTNWEQIGERSQANADLCCQAPTLTAGTKGYHG